MIRTPLSLALAAALCGVPGAAAAQNAASDTVMVEVENSAGEDAGTAEFEQLRHGLLVRLRLTNLTEGGHGVHLHETGACSPDLKAAGSHYNPLGSAHGFDAKGGYHVGALTNVFAGADGIAKADIFVPQVSLHGPENDRYPFTLKDDDGTALMIHADEDDYVSMSSAGAREACGVVFAPEG